MKKQTLLLLSPLFSYAQQPVIPFEFLQMSTAITLMPTFLPTYVTIKHYNPQHQLKNREEIERFINENFESLKIEIAKGEGEYLDTLAELYNLKDKPSWKSYLQHHFEEIYQKGKEKKEVIIHLHEISYEAFNAPKVYSLKEYNERKELKD